MVSVSLCMVLESDATFPSGLEAVLHSVDDISIIILGENDMLKSIFRRYTHQIFIFSENANKRDAWNFCFGNATGDYILWLEAGDTFLRTDLQKFLKLKSDLDASTDAVRFLHNCYPKELLTYNFSYYRNRLVKRNSFMKWYEGLFCYLPINGKVISTDIAVSRFTDKESQTKRISPYEEKLEWGGKLSAEELFSYTEKLFESCEYDSAAILYENFLCDKEGLIEDKLIAIDKLADIYRMKNDSDKEINTLLRSFELDLPRAEFACRLGVIFTERNQPEKAVYWYEQAAKVTKPEDLKGLYRAECWTWLPHFKLCGCYSRLGNYSKANYHNELALGFCPEKKLFLNNKVIFEKLLKNKSVTPGFASEKKAELKKLKIVQVAPNEITISPKDYGGRISLVYNLTEQLIKLGHEVILYCAEGISSSAKMLTYSEKETDPKYITDFVINTLPENVDIIHDHTCEGAMSRCRLGIPIISTIYDNVKKNALNPVYLSERALEKVGENKGYFAYNGINAEDFDYSETKENYLLFMGLLYAHKGVNFALDIAEKTGQKLILAGPIYDMAYYQKEIKNRVQQNSNIIYVGSVGGVYKRNLLKNARCLLFPSVWEEPFGLVMLEAMASGTPVLAFANGAVPEILKDFPELICSNVEDMIHKVLTQKYPEPKVLRDYVVNNFSVERMAKSYIGIYRSVWKSEHK